MTELQDLAQPGPSAHLWKTTQKLNKQAKKRKKEANRRGYKDDLAGKSHSNTSAWHVQIYYSEEGM